MRIPMILPLLRNLRRSWTKAHGNGKQKRLNKQDQIHMVNKPRTNPSELHQNHLQAICDLTYPPILLPETSKERWKPGHCQMDPWISSMCFALLLASWSLGLHLIPYFQGGFKSVPGWGLGTSSQPTSNHDSILLLYSSYRPPVLACPPPPTHHWRGRFVFLQLKFLLIPLKRKWNT